MSGYFVSICGALVVGKVLFSLVGNGRFHWGNCFIVFEMPKQRSNTIHAKFNAMSVRLINKSTSVPNPLRQVINPDSIDGAVQNGAQLPNLQLVKYLESVREDERRRLARELHDQIGQDLVAISLELRSLKKRLPPSIEALNQLDQVQEIVSQLDQRIRDFAWELRPLILDDLGLQDALAVLLEKWAVKNGVKVTYQCVGANRPLLADVECGLYRIVQEALTNISKHSNASLVNVTLKFQSRLFTLVIQDDGQGFDFLSVNSKFRGGQSFGLLGMQERAELIGGILDISSKDNCGTTIQLNLPLFSRKKGRYAKAARLSC